MLPPLRTRADACSSDAGCLLQVHHMSLSLLMFRVEPTAGVLAPGLQIQSALTAGRPKKVRPHRIASRNSKEPEEQKCCRMKSKL